MFRCTLAGKGNPEFTFKHHKVYQILRVKDDDTKTLVRYYLGDRLSDFIVDEPFAQVLRKFLEDD